MGFVFRQRIPFFFLSLSSSSQCIRLSFSSFWIDSWRQTTDPKMMITTFSPLLPHSILLPSPTTSNVLIPESRKFPGYFLSSSIPFSFLQFLLQHSFNNKKTSQKRRYKQLPALSLRWKTLSISFSLLSGISSLSLSLLFLSLPSPTPEKVLQSCYATTNYFGRKVSEISPKYPHHFGTQIELLLKSK